jgi:quercetin dioxygenase-like cupin family protein/ketosteroid isomerase-like protein
MSIDTSIATGTGATIGNVSTVAAIYEAFARGDVAAILDRLDDDVEWEAGARDTGLPYLRPRRGKHEVAEFFPALLGTVELTHFEPQSICDGGDVVMVTVLHAGRIVDGGEVPMTQEAHEWRFTPRGTVASFRHLFDFRVHEDAAAVRSEQYQGRTFRAVGDEIEVLRAGGALELFLLTGPRDSGPPPHAHPWDEVYIGVAGEFEVARGDELVTMAPGQTLAIPAGTLHSYRILSDTSTFYVITSGHRASAFFADLDEHAEPGMPTPETLPGIIDVARRNGLTSPLFS